MFPDMTYYYLSRFFIICKIDSNKICVSICNMWLNTNFSALVFINSLCHLLAVFSCHFPFATF